MFDQTFITTTGKRRPWVYVVGLTGELLALGVLLVLPLIYTDKLPSFGFTNLPVIAPRLLQPKPVRFVTVDRPIVRFARPFNPEALYAPNMNRLRQVVNFTDVIDAPSGDEVPGGMSYVGDPRGVPHAVFEPQRVAADVRPVEPPKRIDPKKPDTPATRIRQGGDVQAARIIRKVIPVYPPLARQARVQGVVKLDGVIAADGTIQQLRVISGHPLLVGAAVEAVRQWVYRPTMLNGEAVEVQAPIDVHFTLAQ